jgi:hypothetical protein
VPSEQPVGAGAVLVPSVVLGSWFCTGANQEPGRTGFVKRVVIYSRSMQTTRRGFFKRAVMAAVGLAVAPKVWAKVPARNGGLLPRVVVPDMPIVDCGTITRCKIQVLTPEQLRGLFLKSEPFEDFDKRMGGKIEERLMRGDPGEDLYAYLDRVSRDQ